MPQDSTSPIANRQSHPQVTLPQAPIGPASVPVDTTLGQPTPSKPGPSRARPPEGPAPAQKPAQRNVSSTPAGPQRGAGSIDRATKALGREIDRTLSELARAKSPRAVASALKSLAKANEKALAKGADPARLQACTKKAIALLGTEDLGKLMRGLDGAAVVGAQDSLADHAPALWQLMTIGRVATDQVQEDALGKLDAAVGEALLGSIRGGAAFDIPIASARISNVFRHAEQSLGGLVAQGVLPLAPHQLRERADETVLSALANEPEAQHKLLICMSSADLHRLAAAAQRLQPHALADPLAGAIAERGAFLASMTEDACKEFLSQAPSAADVLPRDGKPPRLDEFLHRLGELEAHCARSGTQVPESVPHQMKRVHVQVAAALAAGREQLVRARPAELRRIDEAAQRLGVGEDVLLPLRTAAANRNAHLQLECLGALERTLSGIRARDPAATLRQLTQLEALTHDFADVSTAMGRRTPGDRSDIANKEIMRILPRFTTELLTDALEQLQGSFGRTLLATLLQASDDDRSPPEALARLTLVASQLEQLPEQIAARLNHDELAEGRSIFEPRHTEESPIFEPRLAEIPQRRTNAGPPPLEMRQAVQQVMGVAAPEHDNGTRRGVVNDVFRQTFETVLAEPPAAMETTSKKLPSGLEVSHGFFEDAKRRFDFRLPDGSPLIDHEKDFEGWNNLQVDEVVERIDAGAQRLLALYGGDRQVMFVATSRASQSSTAPLQLGAGAVSASGQPAQGNPARLPDGTHGYPFNKHWSSAESKSITFLVGAQGRPQLLVDYRHRGGALEPSNGSPRVYLDPQASSVRMRAHVEYPGPVGQLRALGVPTYEVHLVRHDFQKPYPPPTMQTLFAGDGFDEDGARRELEAHAVARGRGGIVPTVMAIDVFHAEATLEAAEAVVVANQPQAERGEKMRVAHGVVDQVTRQRGPALLACFDKALNEQVGTIRHRYPGDKEALRARPDWPRHMEPPETYDALLTSGSAEAIKAYHAFLRAPTQCPEFVEFSEALEVLRKSPDIAGARALYERWVKPEPTGATSFGAPGQPLPQHELRLNLRADTTQAVLDAIDRVANTPLDADLFGEARGELGAIVDSDLAPAFIADVVAGRA